MRGKDVVVEAFAQLLGITPAYAGKSGVQPGVLPVCWDHPRVCGEKPIAMSL